MGILGPMSSCLHEVRVWPLPGWLDAARWLGPEPFLLSRSEAGHVEATASLSTAQAAAVTTRLRGLGLDGHAVEVSVRPPLGRPALRAARLDDARARREVTPGFTRRGVRLDEEGRYSLTPEALALALGRRAAGLRVIDTCAGSGGNSLGFARAGCEVTAVEIDPARAADARHNAGVYGVADRVRVVAGDARLLLPTLDGDVVFVDPPWGRDYDKRVTRLSDLPLLAELLPLCTRFRQTWLKVPASFTAAELPRARTEAVFGAAPGDLRRIKHLLLILDASGAEVTGSRAPKRS